MSHMGSFTNPTPGSSLDQRFQYTCTGAETDTFVIALPHPRSENNYIAMVMLAFSPSAAQYLCNVPPAGCTTTQIGVIAGVPPLVGDILTVLIQEKS